MPKSGIYQILNTLTDKFYIGSAVNLEQRWRVHKSFLKLNKHPNRFLQFAWNKYGGEDAFKFIVLQYIDNKDHLIVMEQKWINLTECYKENIGYNLSSIAGSNIGVKHSEESKAKRRLLMKGNKYLLGHKHSEETKKKMSLANMGKRPSEETRKKLSLAQIGNKKNLGKKHSEETKKKKSLRYRNQYSAGSENAFANR